MARVVKPPAPLPLNDLTPMVFLAGSIEMGSAEDWQFQFERSLSDLDILILNPRRDTWDASWEQSINNPLFREQVEWELTGLERAAVVAMYFAPTTKAPVTLLELGLSVRSGRLVVACPPGFWRRGNVEIVCRRFGVPLLDSLPDLAVEVRRWLKAERVAADVTSALVRGGGVHPQPVVAPQQAERPPRDVPVEDSPDEKSGVN